MCIRDSYSSVKVSPLEERIFDVSDMNEKPTPEQRLSNYAILGRYVLTPEIFDILENVKPGYGGEIQLTDGLRELCRRSRMVAVDFEGRRYDTGNLCGFLEDVYKRQGPPHATGAAVEATNKPSCQRLRREG